MRIRELESSLDYAQRDADACREIVSKLEQERDEAREKAAAAVAAATLGTRGMGPGSSLGGTPQESYARVSRRPSDMGSLSSMHGGADTQLRTSSGKWQLQNKVGGGSLYGLSDESGSGQFSSELVGGIDLVYLKNVLLKFMEAVMAGKVAERDALLPAIAALLQATPAEFNAMKKVLANTAPPSTQMLSALGLKF